MKVRMLRNPAKSMGCKLQEGQEGNVSAELAAKLVKAGVATSVDLEKQLLKEKEDALKKEGGEGGNK